MGSTLSVSEIKGLTSGSNANTISVSSGHTLKMSGMPVQIQVKHVATKQTFSNSASVAGVDTVVVSDPFTPKFSDSKIFVQIMPMLGASNFNGGLGIKRTVGGVDTFVQANPLGSYSSGTTAPNAYFTMDDGPLDLAGNRNGQYAIENSTNMYALDTHGTTSAITYTMTFHSAASNETLVINQPSTNPTQGFGQSVIVLQEWVT